MLRLGSRFPVLEEGFFGGVPFRRHPPIGRAGQKVVHGSSQRSLGLDRGLVSEG